MKLIRAIQQGDVVNNIRKVLDNLYKVINGGLDLQNLNGVALQITVSVANVPKVITHNLGRNPTAFIVIGQNDTGGAGVPYYQVVADGSLWTTTTIVLRFTLIGGYKLYIL